MRSWSLAIVSFLLFEILITQVSCSAATYQLQDEINAYNQNDFNNVVFIGRLLENEATDSIYARYYLANAYTRLNRIPEAIEEYTVCWREGKNRKIIAYAQQALQVLQSNLGSSSASNYSSSTSPSNGAQDQSWAAKDRIMQEEENEIARLTATTELPSLQGG